MKAETTKINGRQYTVIHEVPCGELTSQVMKKNGWLPSLFQLEGKRGACWMAHKSARTGQYSLVTNLR